MWEGLELGWGSRTKSLRIIISKSPNLHLTPIEAMTHGAFSREIILSLYNIHGMGRQTSTDLPTQLFTLIFFYPLSSSQPPKSLGLTVFIIWTQLQACAQTLQMSLQHGVSSWAALSAYISSSARQADHYKQKYRHTLYNRVLTKCSVCWFKTSF